MACDDPNAIVIQHHWNGSVCLMYVSLNRVYFPMHASKNLEMRFGWSRNLSIKIGRVKHRDAELEREFFAISSSAERCCASFRALRTVQGRFA